MADGLKFEIEGGRQLKVKLEGLSYDMQRKGGRFALRKAAQLIARKAADNARRLDDPETGEQIAKNIVNGNKYPGVRWDGSYYNETGNLAFRIGVQGGAKAPAIASGEFSGKGKDNPGGDTFYWRFLEFGTENIQATEFMRPALRNNTAPATAEFVKQYDKALDRALRKLKRPG